MLHTEIEETLALLGDLRDIARESGGGSSDHDFATHRKLLRVVAEISHRLTQLEERITDVPAPAVSKEEAHRQERLIALGRVTAEVGHQLNSLLAVLATRLELADLCIREGDREKATANSRLAREYLRKAETLAVRLTDVSGRPAANQRGDLNRIVEDTVCFARLLGPYRNIEFDTDLAADLAPVLIDPARWQQVLLSLFANAADAVGRRRGEGGRVRIRTTNLPDQGQVMITVEDEGRGITSDVLPRVFDPGFTTKGGESDGLGLATCHRIVEEAGGEISIESEQGRGTTVAIRLPDRR